MYSCENPKCENTWIKKNSQKKYCCKACKLYMNANDPSYKAKCAERAAREKAARTPHKRTCAYRLCDDEFTTTTRRIFCCDDHTRLEAIAKAHDKVLLLQGEVKNCKHCNDEFYGGNKNRVYCCNNCLHKAAYQRNKPIPKIKVAKVKKARIRKPKGKKMYTPISKPEGKKKVVMALSKEVINCLEPEKKKADDLVNRSYTEEEADMVEKFLANR